jgi:hypothetical protein
MLNASLILVIMGLGSPHLGSGRLGSITLGIGLGSGWLGSITLGTRLGSGRLGSIYTCDRAWQRPAWQPMLRFRDVHPGSQIRIFHPGSRIHIKEFKYFNPKMVSKL